MKITKEKLDIIATYMDDEIREKVHFEMAPCEPTDFLKRYLELVSMRKQGSTLTILTSLLRIGTLLTSTSRKGSDFCLTTKLTDGEVKAWQESIRKPRGKLRKGMMRR